MHYMSWLIEILPVLWESIILASVYMFSDVRICDLFAVIVMNSMIKLLVQT